MARNLLVTLADRNFVEQAKQLFSSVYWNAGWKGDYMLLAHDIPEPELQWFSGKGILVKEVKPLSNHDFADKTLRYPATVASKLALFSEEFKKWGVVVFIDGDCIVRYPLDSVTRTKGFAVARDWLTTALIKLQIRNWQGMSEAEYSRLFNGYSPTATAFNTGFFAFNTGIIDSNTQARLKLIFDKYLEYSRFGEQLCANLFFYKQWERLPMEYNLFATYLNVRRRLPKQQVDGVVLHFPRFGDEAGCRCWDIENAFYDEWKANLNRAELIDLDRIPEPNRKWPTLAHIFYQRWRMRMAMRADYIGFCRNKFAVRKRLSKVIAAIKSWFL